MERYNRGAPASGFGGSIAVVSHEIGAREHLSHDLALDADSSAVDDSELFQPAAVGLAQIFLDHGLDVVRRDRMQIDNVLYRKLHRFGKRIVQHDPIIQSIGY